nr:MAG TPA: hypothetical protein [Caudoviricetes sp.]DAQ83005.1 MAG TPA: hypothetical protein [Caudoviricetes sp.]
MFNCYIYIFPYYEKVLLKNLNVRVCSNSPIWYNH